MISYTFFSAGAIRVAYDTVIIAGLNVYALVNGRGVLVFDKRSIAYLNIGQYRKVLCAMVCDYQVTGFRFNNAC